MSQSIPIKCFTNIDDFSYAVWPNVLICRPMVGDHIKEIGGKGRSLSVVRITHCQTDRSDNMLIVELHNGLDKIFPVCIK